MASNDAYSVLGSGGEDEKPCGKPAHPLDETFANPERPSGPVPEAPPAQRAYAVFFTPRSGSSLLQELCARSGVLGLDGEVFNWRTMYDPVRQRGRFFWVPSDSVEAYADGLRRKFKSAADVYGFEATPYQVHPLLKDGRWWRIFRDLEYCVLTRRDFVAQAVSLYLKEVAGFGHTNSPQSEALWTRYESASYDPRRIYRWIRHVLNAEWLIERHIGQHAPLRLVYEEFVADKARAVQQVAKHVGVTLPASLHVEGTGHRKLGGERNSTWAERFREEYWWLVLELERIRGTERIQQVEKNRPGYVSGLLGRC